MEQRGRNLGGQDRFGSFINTKALWSRWSEWQDVKDVGEWMNQVWQRQQHKPRWS